MPEIRRGRGGAFEVDQAHFNRWLGEFFKITGVDVPKGTRKVGLDMMNKTMKRTKVRTGRLRMGFSGVHKLEGKTPPMKGKDGVAQYMGLRKAHAIEKKGATTYLLIIVNAVSYALKQESLHGMVRNTFRHFIPDYQKKVSLLMIKAAEKSQK
jgi:hypothetical protein